MEIYDVIAIALATLLVALYALGVRRPTVHLAWLGVAIYLTVPLIAAVKAAVG